MGFDVTECEDDGSFKRAVSQRRDLLICKITCLSSLFLKSAALDAAFGQSMKLNEFLQSKRKAIILTCGVCVIRMRFTAIFKEFHDEGHVEANSFGMTPLNFNSTLVKDIFSFQIYLITELPMLSKPTTMYRNAPVVVFEKRRHLMSRATKIREAPLFTPKTYDRP